MRFSKFCDEFGDGIGAAGGLLGHGGDDRHLVLGAVRQFAHQEADLGFGLLAALAGLLDGGRNGGDLGDRVVAGGDRLAGAEALGVGLEAAHGAADLQRHPIDDEDDDGGEQQAADGQRPDGIDQGLADDRLRRPGDQRPAGEEGLADGGAIGFAVGAEVDEAGRGVAARRSRRGGNARRSRRRPSDAAMMVPFLSIIATFQPSGSLSESSAVSSVDGIAGNAEDQRREGAGRRPGRGR